MITSTNFSNHFDREVRESFINGTQEVIKRSAFNKIFHVVDDVDYEESWTSDEGITEVDFIDEHESLVDLDTPEGFKVTLESEEFGGSIRISLKFRKKAKSLNQLMDRIVKRRKNKTMVAMMNFIERQSHSMLNNGFDSGADILAPDGVELFGTHSWNSSDNTFINQLVGDPILDSDGVDQLEEYGADFVDAQGMEMPLSFDTIIVRKGTDAAREAKRLFAFGITPTLVASINIYEGEYTIIETPYLSSSDKKRWFAVDNMIQEEPSLQVRFVDRVEVEDLQVAGNLDFVYPVTASFKFGAVNMPFEWAASDPA